MKEFYKHSIFDDPKKSGAFSVDGSPLYTSQYDAKGRVRLLFSQELLVKSSPSIYDAIMNSKVVKVIAGRENKWNDTYEMLVEGDDLPQCLEGAEAPIWSFNYSKELENFYISPRENGYPRIYLCE